MSYESTGIELENIITSQPTINSLLANKLQREDPIEVLTELASVNIISYNVRKKGETIRKYFIDNVGKNLFVGNEDETHCFSRKKKKIVFKVWGSNELAFSIIISNRCFSDVQLIKITTPLSDFIGNIKQTGRGSKSGFEIENSKNNKIFSVNKSKEDANFNFDVLHEESEQMTKMQISCSNGLPCRTVLYPNGIALVDKILLTVCGILITNIPVKIKNTCEPQNLIEAIETIEAPLEEQQLLTTGNRPQQMMNTNNHLYEPFEDDHGCEAILRLCCIQHCFCGNSTCCDEGNSNRCDDENSHDCCGDGNANDCCGDGNSNDCCGDGNSNDCCGDGNSNDCCGDGASCIDGGSCCDCN